MNSYLAHTTEVFMIRSSIFTLHENSGNSSEDDISLLFYCFILIDLKEKQVLNKSLFIIIIINLIFCLIKYKIKIRRYLKIML